MVKSIFKENREKLALKRSGHFLLNTIMWKGYSKDAIYYLLAEELGVDEEFAHFAKMNTLRELRAAVPALERIEKRLPRTVHASKGPRPRRRKSIPDTRENVFATRDQPKFAPVAPPKEKKPQPMSKKQRKKNEFTLPRAEQLRILEEMRRDHEAKKKLEGITLYDDDLSGPWPIEPPLADSPSPTITEKGGILSWIKSKLHGKTSSNNQNAAEGEGETGKPHQG